MTTSASPPGRAGRGRTARAAVLAAVGLATVGVVGIGATPRAPIPVARGVLPRTASSPRPVAAQRARAARDATSPTTPIPPPEPAVAAPPVDETTLQSPEDVPDPNVRRPISMIGRIRIPRLWLDTELRDQITQESIDLGPSHWPGTARPGGYGNAVIAGHRNSHTAPFHDLGILAVGDTIDLVDTTGHTFTYSVTETFVVDPSAMWITEQQPGHTLTIFTCHPLGSSSQRLVVRATLT